MLLRRANTTSSLLATSFVLPFGLSIPYLIGRYHPMPAILTLQRESIPFHPHNVMIIYSLLCASDWKIRETIPQTQEAAKKEHSCTAESSMFIPDIKKKMVPKKAKTDKI